jgi:2-oxoglutarate ferredoxin oxidoreductase subunit alpha
MDMGDEIELLAVGWGSTGDVFQDVMGSDELRGRKTAYLHYTYLWPLRTQELQRLANQSKRIVLVEQNYQGQLGMLIRMECGLDIPDKILKYDGRPFFYDIDEVPTGVVLAAGMTATVEIDDRRRTTSDTKPGSTARPM